ncbi:MAG: helix-hairpin-helix domain-containing protein [Bdellovibrionota bacterium]
MRKQTNPEDVRFFEEIPNIGEAMAEDFRLLNIKDPQDLKKQNAYELYVKLCRKTKTYQDPCVLDVFLSAIYFMKGKGTKMWWEFTAERKKNFHIVSADIASLK